MDNKPTNDCVTTRQAWLELADWWENPTVCGCGCGRQVVHPNCAGLCASISILRNRGFISEAQEADMFRALPRIPGKEFLPGVRPFLWDTTPEGAKERVAFCREQADKLATKGRRSA